MNQNNLQPEVWSMTAYYSESLAEAEFTPDNPLAGRIRVTDIIGAKGQPQRATIDGSTMIGDEKYVKLSVMNDNHMAPMTVRKSELVDRRAEAKAAHMAAAVSRMH